MNNKTGMDNNTDNLFDTTTSLQASKLLHLFIGSLVESMPKTDGLSKINILKMERLFLQLKMLDNIQTRMLDPNSDFKDDLFILTGDQAYCLENGLLRDASLDELSNKIIDFSKKK